MAKLDISNVVSVSLLSALKGLADVNTSALALITNEEPISSSYGTYGIYKSPTGVASDFGSDSDTYRLAIMVFSQSPSILTAGGYLVVIPRTQSAAAQPATIIGTSTVNLRNLTASDYELYATIDGGTPGSLTIGDVDYSSMEAALASLNSAEVTAAGLVFSLSGSVTSALVTLSTSGTGATKSIVIGTPSTGSDIAALLGIDGLSATGAATGVERVKDCILRTAGSIPYFGIILNEKQADATLLEIANLVQCYDKLLFVGSNLSADMAGIFKSIKDASLSHTRCLYYSVSEDDALDFAAGYASRGLCMKMDGANTAHTMHLKEIAGLDADEGMTQTLLDTAMNDGVDTYPDIGGLSKVFISGQNLFFDQIYTRLAFKLRLQVAGFNYLAQTNTKIPQTEAGMTGLKGALREICKMFVNNGTFAPGTWNSSLTFGDPEDHVRNIADIGYFIYSDAISDQSQAEREARVAPSIYIAAKDAGAIHSADIVAYVEA